VKSYFLKGYSGATPARLIGVLTDSQVQFNRWFSVPHIFLGGGSPVNYVEGRSVILYWWNAANFLRSLFPPQLPLYRVNVQSLRWLQRLVIEILCFSYPDSSPEIRLALLFRGATHKHGLLILLGFIVPLLVASTQHKLYFCRVTKYCMGKLKYLRDYIPYLSLFLLSLERLYWLHLSLSFIHKLHSSIY